ncbi:VIT1/CCC1 family predicted Fe2+/Mn2+ transporter [Staphylococcus epidermidis]
MLVTIVSWILTFLTLVAIGSLITKLKNKSK